MTKPPGSSEGLRVRSARRLERSGRLSGAGCAETKATIRERTEEGWS